METTTQYLYEYENGKRVRNIGFMKIDKQMDKNLIQIYARNIDDIQGILFRKGNGETYIGSWEELIEETEEIDDYIPPSNITYEKIQRQDLSRLPRREWRIANNSFLLHGYRNYHHLLYIEEEGDVWIGVPGIFHEKEQSAANAFGFPEFRRLTDVDFELEEEEKNNYEDFGYWCRQIPNE
jgi:hypothetical protein